MSVTGTYTRTCEKIGQCIGLTVVGAFLGGAAGCAAAQMLKVNLVAGAILGVASGSTSLSAFKACNLSNRVSHCCEIAAAGTVGLAVGTAAGYLALYLAHELPPLESFLPLAASTYAFALSEFACLRGLCQWSRARQQTPVAEEQYQRLEAQFT
jgi:hypothetical protein